MVALANRITKFIPTKEDRESNIYYLVCFRIFSINKTETIGHTTLGPMGAIKNRDDITRIVESLMVKFRESHNPIQIIITSLTKLE